MPRVTLDGASCPELLEDLEDAAHSFVRRFERRPDLWNRALEGKWSGGQHAEHVVKMLAMLSDGLETSRTDLEHGELPPLPRRGFLQRWFVGLVTQGERFPRGGRAPARGKPGKSPDSIETLAALDREVARYRALVAGLSDSQRERLWTRNPFAGFGLRWHYTLPEGLRVQAQHIRHHAALVDEITTSDSEG